MDTDAVPLTSAQLKALETTERVASCFSLVGTIFIFLTFISSPNFRRPINRLVFYASWGNTLCNVGTLISESGVNAGAHSPLCQFQAFLIQMFVPADALWNLAMAFNVYLTLFKKYNAQQLKALEWKYHILCYGTPFVLAFIMIFVETHARGKIYGPAMLWCWISEDWEFLRIALCYGPAWICIIIAFTIYLISGREIFQKRRELRAFNSSSHEDSWANLKTTQIAVTSELGNVLPLGTVAECFDPKAKSLTEPGHQFSRSTKDYEQYSVNIASPPVSVRPAMPQSLPSVQHKKNKATIETNRAAWGYTKVALLFFVSLLVTWVPSSANRLYALAHPGRTNIGLAYVAGLVLSLMGFWNSVIYIVTSRAACKALIITIFTRGNSHLHEKEIGAIRGPLGHRRSVQRVSWGYDFERLAEERGSM
ncbi:MAG: hypothetical protein Q9217_003767 [Psora testacea]